MEKEVKSKKTPAKKSTTSSKAKAKTTTKQTPKSTTSKTSVKAKAQPKKKTTTLSKTSAKPKVAPVEQQTKVVNVQPAKQKTKKDATLIATFVFLIIVVIVLAIVALNIKNITAFQKSDVVIPVLAENTKNEISIDIAEVLKTDEKEYVFAVSNYKEHDVNEEAIKYDIKVTAPKTVNVKLYKNNKDKDLLSVNPMSANHKLPANDKMKDTYKLVVEGNIGDNDDSKITIEISS